ncbi:mucin-5AC isoform X2 [Drosophila biarmipes]|uniref:mucin-5AC isoform X2 n=1 Tax=Drosophila biarmipes TaxID=125945 RepID=UPI0021CC5E6A|nr:mucin-5AC isoform X2 [Drosophila biarmipes]
MLTEEKRKCATSFDLQMWSMDHPGMVLYRQHPNAMRKFYWYGNRTPILVGKMRLKNYMRSMQMLPRYVHPHVPYHEAYANSKRSVFRDLNNVHGFRTTSTPSTTTTVDYVAAPVNTIEYSSGPVSPPVDFSIAPVNAFVPLAAGTVSKAERLMGVMSPWNHSDYSDESWKNCPGNCFKNSFPDYPKDQYSSHSMPSEQPVTTTTALPYFNYVAHTYFTLDDVILPHSASKFTKTPTEEQQFRPSHAEFTTETPQGLFTERLQRTTQPLATSTATTTEFTPAKTTFFDFEYSTRPIWFSSTTSTTTTTEPAPTVSQKPQIWTTPQPTQSIFTTASTTTQSYKHRLKSLKATKNFSSNIETKLKLLKLHLKNLVTTRETPRNIQNLTTSAVIESSTTLPDAITSTPTTPTRRTNVNRKLRKLRVLASTKKVPVQTSRNSTNSNKTKVEYKKSKRIYQRRKHLNSTAAPVPTMNTTIVSIDNESINKFKRRTTASTQKSTVIDENVIVRNSTKANRHTAAKSRADGVPEEKSQLVTESAIMTISSGTLRMRQPVIQLKSKQHSTRKIKHLENDNFIPSLPIEVYFKKVNQQ